MLLLSNSTYLHSELCHNVKIYSSCRTQNDIIVEDSKLCYK